MSRAIRGEERPSTIWLPWQRPTCVTWSQNLGRDYATLYKPLDYVYEGIFIDHKFETDVLVASSGAAFESTHPLNDPYLWDRFAKKDVTRRQVIELCKQYGFLDKQEVRDCPPIYESALGYETLIFIETYDLWKRELGKLALAKEILAFFKECQDRGKIDYKYLESVKDMIKNRPKGDYMNWDDRYFNAGVEEEKGKVRELSANTPRSDIELVIEVFHDLAEPYLARVDLKLMTEEGGLLPHLMYAPRNLLAGLWLQLTVFSTGNRHVKRCEICGQLFLAKYSNAKMCSDACIQRSYRNRNRKQ